MEVGEERRRMIKQVVICDVCGKELRNGGFRWIRRFIFHIEMGSEKLICNECYEQLVEMRKANILAERRAE